jgi:hypothetical protein
MTDFANDPLWEEDTKEPELVKTPPQEQPDVVAAAGNAATARAMTETVTPEMVAKPMMPQIQEAAVVKPLTDEPVPDIPTAEPTIAEPEEVLDWRTPLQAVVKTMDDGHLDRALPPFLEMAAQIPAPQVPMAAGLVLSAFLRLPMGARQTVREVLIANLSDWPGLPVARLILIRLGGLPVAPPPPPPAPAGDA